VCLRVRPVVFLFGGTTTHTLHVTEYIYGSRVPPRVCHVCTLWHTHIHSCQIYFIYPTSWVPHSCVVVCVTGRKRALCKRGSLSYPPRVCDMVYILVLRYYTHGFMVVELSGFVTAFLTCAILRFIIHPKLNPVFVCVPPIFWIRLRYLHSSYHQRLSKDDVMIVFLIRRE
jgi:hypothetical protein